MTQFKLNNAANAARLPLLRIVIALACHLVAITGVHAVTWYVTPDGSGDVPTIQAGIDAASVGNNVIRENRSMADGCGIKMSQSHSQILDNVICWNQAQFAGGGIHVSGGTTTIRGNTVASNRGGGVGLFQTQATFSKNLVVNTLTGNGLACGAAANVLATCNNFWANAYGNSTACSLGTDNVSLDPVVCITSADYEVHASSPCLPSNNPCGVLIGARGEGCVATSSEGQPLCATLAIHTAPNPTRGTSVVSYTLPGDARLVQLVVHDLRGRVVARLAADGTTRFGSAHWDGRDTSGAAVGAGIYFVSLQTDRVRVAEKIIVTR